MSWCVVFRCVQLAMLTTKGCLVGGQPSTSPKYQRFDPWVCHSFHFMDFFSYLYNFSFHMFGPSCTLYGLPLPTLWASSSYSCVSSLERARHKKIGYIKLNFNRSLIINWCMHLYIISQWTIHLGREKPTCGWQGSREQLWPNLIILAWMKLYRTQPRS